MRLDLRSLAAFRIVIGFIILDQSMMLLRDVHPFFQSGGIFRQSGSERLMESLIFIVLPASAICLTCGLVTRFANITCFATLVTIQNSCPQILQGGDTLLRLLLFWSCFLPVGGVWSLDAQWLHFREFDLQWTERLASWAFTIQVCLVYWSAGLLKSDPLWTENGNALFYALNIEHFTTGFGLYMRQWSTLLQAGSLSTRWFELIGPCLLFSPYHRQLCRMGAIILFVSFHLIAMQSLLRIGLFPWVCSAAWLAFLPPRFWDLLNLRIREPSNRSLKRQKDRVEGAVVRSPRILDHAISAVIVVCLIDVLIWNFASLRGDKSERWMYAHDMIGEWLRLDQRWNMYAPSPRKIHGWLIVPADLTDGTEVDLFTREPVSWEKPNDIGAYLGDDRWRRYLSNLFDDQDPKMLQEYADYLVRNWNQRHETNKQVQVVTIVFMREKTRPDLTISPPERDTLYYHAY